MKKKNLWTGLVALAIVLACLAFFLTKQKQATPITAGGSSVNDIKARGVLRVGVKQDVPNFGYLNPDKNDFEGMEVDIARAVADELGVKAEFTPVTAQTRGALLDNGQVDMVIATFTINDERKKLYNFTIPYYTDAVGFLVNKDSGVQSVEDLDGKEVGVAQGSTTRTLIDELAKKHHITVHYTELGSYPELSVALQAHRIDTFSVDQSILSGYVSDKSEIMDFNFSASDYGIATKKSNTSLNDYLNGLIDQWTSDGQLQKWYDQNGLKPVTSTQE